MLFVFEIIKVISAIVVAVAAVATARYAYKGLSIWKEQHSGKIGSDLATRLLASIRKYQDAMNDSVSLPDDEEILEFLYPRKQQKYQDRNLLLEEIYPSVIESEALWGKEIELIFNKMCKIEESIKKNDKKLSEHLHIIRSPEGYGEFIIDETKLNTKSIRKEREKFQEQLNNLIKEAEDFLKQKIL